MVRFAPARGARPTTDLVAEEALGLVVQQYPQSKRAEHGSEGEVEQLKGGEDDGEDSRPRAKVEEAEAGNHTWDRQQDQEDEEKYSNRAEDGYGDKAGIRECARKAGNASEQKQKQEGGKESKTAEDDVKEREESDLGSHKIAVHSRYAERV